MIHPLYLHSMVPTTEVFHSSPVGQSFIPSALLSSFLRRLDRVSSSNSLFDRRNDSSGVRHTTRRPLFLPWRARRDGRRGRLGVFAALERDATSELGPGAHGARVAQAPVAWAAQAVQNGLTLSKGSLCISLESCRCPYSEVSEAHLELGSPRCSSLFLFLFGWMRVS